MKHKLYISTILSTFIIALALFFTNTADAETANIQDLSCTSGCPETKQASTVPTVSSIVRLGSNPTNAQTVEFEVTFSEPVTGVDMNDFAPVVQGVGFALVTDVRGSGSTYIVSVYTGYGEGTLSLDVVDNDTIMNKSGETLGGVGLYNGDFTSAETYAVVR